MFDMMKMMGKLGEVKQKMAEAQEKIAQMQASGESGAGMVKATVTGSKKLIGLEIDPSLLQASEATMLRDQYGSKSGRADGQRRNEKKYRGHAAQHPRLGFKCLWIIKLQSPF